MGPTNSAAIVTIECLVLAGRFVCAPSSVASEAVKGEAGRGGRTREELEKDLGRRGYGQDSGLQPGLHVPPGVCEDILGVL
jgi:hypothetical protein